MDIISDWKERFKKACVGMGKEGLVSIYFPDRGYIKWFFGKKCKECGEKGIFFGYDLEYGSFYEYTTADYCPNCFNVNVDVSFTRKNQKKFLPIMKKELLEKPGLRSELKEADPCPECGGPCLSYEKDLGVIDYWDNTWVVCINPNCNWPGEHHEIFTTGLW